MEKCLTQARPPAGPRPSGSRVLSILRYLDHKRRKEENHSEQPYRGGRSRHPLTRECHRKRGSQHRAYPGAMWEGPATALRASFRNEQPASNHEETLRVILQNSWPWLFETSMPRMRKAGKLVQIKGGSGRLNGGPRKTRPPRSWGM